LHRTPYQRIDGADGYQAYDRRVGRRYLNRCCIEPRFDFVRQLSRAPASFSPPKPADEQPSFLRLTYSYVAVYGDPLFSPQLDPYPDGFLQRLSAVGVNARPKTPFVPKSFVMSSYAAVKRPLDARRVTIRLAEALGPARPSLPTPFAAQKADLIEVQAPREVRTIPPGGLTPLAGAELKNIKASRLHVAVFGANPEDRYADKPVTLNGVAIGILPPNARHATDQWVEQIMEIPADKLAAIAAENVVVVANCGGDAFKFGDAALAVQRPDGTWVESNRLSTVYCGCGTGGGWPHHEGVGFSTKSPPIKLTLPVAP